jgi:hypothetical protein
VFFEILNGFLLTFSFEKSCLLTFYPLKKVAPPLIRAEKNVFEIERAGYQKNRNFALISKMCKSLEFGKREKQIYLKTEFLGTWKILQKIVFLRKNLWELLDARVLHIFKISAKFRFF